MEYPSGECKCCDKLADENVALKEQVAQWETEYNGCSAMLDNAERIIEILEETIGQQAAVIEQMRSALHLAANNMTYVGAKNWDIIANALLLQPSAEILEEHNQRVAEACAKLGDTVKEQSRHHLFRSAAEIVASEIRSGEWRKYL